METINQRISYLIENLGIRKTAVAKRLKVSPAFVSQVCSGVSGISDRTIWDICREFHVNEDWLRHGEGEMFQPQDRNQEIAQFMGDLLNDPDLEFQRKLVSILAKLDIKEWKLLENMALRLMEEEKEKPGQ